MAEPGRDGRIPAPSSSQLAFGWIGAGLLVGSLLAAGLVLLGVVTADDVVAEWLVLGIMFGPPILGTGLIALPGPSARRSFGAGLMMGWGVALIVSSGLCIGGAIRTPFFKVG